MKHCYCEQEKCGCDKPNENGDYICNGLDVSDHLDLCKYVFENGGKLIYIRFNNEIWHPLCMYEYILEESFIQSECSFVCDICDKKKIGLHMWNGCNCDICQECYDVIVRWKSANS